MRRLSRGAATLHDDKSIERDSWGLARQVYEAMHPLGGDNQITEEMISAGAAIIWEKEDFADDWGSSMPTPIRSRPCLQTKVASTPRPAKALPTTRRSRTRPANMRAGPSTPTPSRAHSPSSSVAWSACTTIAVSCTCTATYNSSHGRRAPIAFVKGIIWDRMEVLVHPGVTFDTQTRAALSPDTLRLRQWRRAASVARNLLGASGGTHPPRRFDQPCRGRH